MSKTEFERYMPNISNDDMYVCEHCGNEDIKEKIWVSVNDIIVKDRKTYSAYVDDAEDCIWCDDCDEETTFCTKTEYKKQKGDIK